MAKLSNHDLKECHDSGQAYNDLAQMAKTTKPLASRPKVLPLSEIHVARQVFQWRMRGRGVFQKRQHVLDMARALQDEGTRLPPLLVYLIGERFFVLDGHHRLDAYHTAGWTEPISIDVFDGSLEEARTLALKLNSRTKLPMSRDDKSEAAWTLTKTTDLSIARVHELSTVSPRNISYMRAAWREVREHFESREGRPTFGNRYASIEDLRDKLRWSRARMVLHGIKFTDDDDWRDHKADELAELLTNHVGDKLMRHPDITADALRKLHPELPRALIHEWAFEEAEVIKALAERPEVEEVEF